MEEKRKQITIMIMSEPEAKEVSVSHSIRFIFRDFGFLFRAVFRHAKRYVDICARGWDYKNRWWNR